MNHDETDHEKADTVQPSFKPRTPYIMHYDDQTVALGDPEFLGKIEAYLTDADLATRTTYWDQAYLDSPGTASSDETLFAPDPDPSTINSVGIEGTEEVFWNAMEAAVFQQAEWPQGEDATVYFPEYPDWLANAQSWYFDPICPPLGPGGVGGWIRRRTLEGRGYPVGLFQLTDSDSFWIFASEDDLTDIMDLCSQLSRFRQGFDKVTPYIGNNDMIGSAALPLVCKDVLQEELMIRGVDVETLFWE